MGHDRLFGGGRSRGYEGQMGRGWDTVVRREQVVHQRDAAETKGARGPGRRDAEERGRADFVLERRGASGGIENGQLRAVTLQNWDAAPYVSDKKATRTDDGVPSCSLF